MISIKPFKAIRPPRDKAYLVATRSYLSYSEDELDEKLQNNPFTFLHVINPSKGRSLPFGKEKYEEVKKCFKKFANQGVFTQDSTENYYLYRQVKEGNEYIGLIAAVSVEDYFEGKIKKHENTLTNREKMFTDYLESTGFNAEPVLLTYRDDFRLNKIFAEYIEQRSEYEFTSTDKVLHQLWLIEDQKHIKQITEAFKDQEALYIADGHHRCSSSSLLAERLADKPGQDHRHFMAFLIGEEQMKVYDFNRLIKGTNGKSEEQLVEELHHEFLVEPIEADVYKPEKFHEIGMYINGNWYKLVPKTGSFNPQSPVGRLDAEILSKKILKPILGIQNLKTDSRAGFLPGTEGVSGLKSKVDSGAFDIAFALYPVAVEQIKQVADAEKTMPPKSTYIEPKLRSGLTIYQILEN
ncbi:DUF1015 domain-containing protein [Owenweeksia hongkongensis]|uniref:DUF1015 domain-containing protein n=1 Tax=Owenweeksia hongkongensis TaxID=253245 RepID=UPI003A8D8102